MEKADANGVTTFHAWVWENWHLASQEEVHNDSSKKRLLQLPATEVRCVERWKFFKKKMVWLIKEKGEFNEDSVVTEVQTSSFTAAFRKRNWDDISEIWTHYQAAKIQSTY